MNKRFLLSAFLIVSACLTFAQQPKYVFYFIGDGMGVNQVQGTSNPQLSSSASFLRLNVLSSLN